MFCFNCGKEISNEQKFCCYCGAENKMVLSGAEEQMAPSKPISKDTLFNHDVLTNYLYNLQTLEFAKNLLSSEKRSLEDRIDRLGRQNQCIPGKNTIEDYFYCYGGVIFLGIVYLVAVFLEKGLNGDGFFSIFDDLLLPVVNFVKIAAIVIAIILVVVAILDYIQDHERYNNSMKAEKERLTIELAEKDTLLIAFPVVELDLEQTEELLNEAYAINIIPDKYRNLGAVNFLYKNISTSTMTLKEALYHCDLDEISSKLSVIIEQQQEMIMQMARSNALNEQIIRQNEEMLQHAIATENNTALAAQYSQVAAINTSTVAQVQSYYFFKNGL